MKYLIECPYCGNTYTVQSEHNISFNCPNCGARNGQENILQREDEKAKLQQAVDEYIARQKKEEENVRAIERKQAALEKEQAYDEFRRRQQLKSDSYSSEYSSSSSDSSPSSGSLGTAIWIIFVVIALCCWISQEITENSRSEYHKHLLNNNESLYLSLSEEMDKINRSADTNALRTLMTELVSATVQEDYDSILPHLYEANNDSKISENKLKELYADTFLGKYLGDSNIKLKKVAYVSSYHDSQTYKTFEEYEITLSNGKYDSMLFYKTSSGEWLISVKDTFYYY